MTRKRLWWTASPLFVAITYVILNLKAWNWYLTQERCITPVNEMKDLKELILDTHDILDKFHLSHALIFGSLFGALRIGDVLPWDTDFDCALFRDEIDRIDEKLLVTEFQKKGIKSIYRRWFGTFRVTRKSARGDLVIFQKNFFGDHMIRTGIEPWAFILNHYYYHRFPINLFKRPLPTLPFIGKNMSVPHGGIELQKYAYPNDWWEVTKPKCNKENH